MNKNVSIEPLLNKTVALNELCVQQYGFAQTIDILIEALEDHIKNNLKREIDQQQKEFMQRKITQLEAIK